MSVSTFVARSIEAAFIGATFDFRLFGDSREIRQKTGVFDLGWGDEQRGEGKGGYGGVQYSTLHIADLGLPGYKKRERGGHAAHMGKAP